MHEHKTTVRLYDTDASGRIFFASVFRLAHDGLETALAARGSSLRSFLENGSASLTVVHADADLKRPLTVGDEVTVRLCAGRIGDTSCTLNFTLNTTDGTEAVTGSWVLVSIDPATGAKTPLTAPVRELLARL